eukprot:TRINITY_DN19780_c0_g1_i1.p1 TRINITY_DN19780_c0_g1~~TRINITY_DN19780_c0_g1_i1.p1  ORF type:complete len:637 (+),score=69.93 TRINITY_DN19780_c0_g1_i1:82-1992(+)
MSRSIVVALPCTAPSPPPSCWPAERPTPTLETPPPNAEVPISADALGGGGERARAPSADEARLRRFAPLTPVCETFDDGVYGGTLTLLRPTRAAEAASRVAAAAAALATCGVAACCADRGSRGWRRQRPGELYLPGKHRGALAQQVPRRPSAPRRPSSAPSGRRSSRGSVSWGRRSRANSELLAAQLGPADHGAPPQHPCTLLSACVWSVASPSIPHSTTPPPQVATEGVPLLPTYLIVSRPPAGDKAQWRPSSASAETQSGEGRAAAGEICAAWTRPPRVPCPPPFARGSSPQGVTEEPPAAPSPPGRPPRLRCGRPPPSASWLVAGGGRPTVRRGAVGGRRLSWGARQGFLAVRAKVAASRPVPRLQHSKSPHAQAAMALLQPEKRDRVCQADQSRAPQVMAEGPEVPQSGPPLQIDDVPPLSDGVERVRSPSRTPRLSRASSRVSTGSRQEPDLGDSARRELRRMQSTRESLRRWSAKSAQLVHRSASRGGVRSVWAPLLRRLMKDDCTATTLAGTLAEVAERLGVAERLSALPQVDEATDPSALARRLQAVAASLPGSRISADDASPPNLPEGVPQLAPSTEGLLVTAAQELRQRLAPSPPTARSMRVSPSPGGSRGRGRAAAAQPAGRASP